MSSSFSTKLDLSIAVLTLRSAGYQLVICDFLAFGPCMGEYGIWRRVVGMEDNQFEHVAVWLAGQ